MNDDFYNFMPEGPDPLRRPTSAPPNLELQTESLFAFRSDFNQIFSDIRLEESYPAFYEAYAEHAKLPPPLEPYVIEPKDVDSALRDELARYTQQTGGYMQHMDMGGPHHFMHQEGNGNGNTQPNGALHAQLAAAASASDASVWSPLPRRFSKFSLGDPSASIGSNPLLPNLSSESDAFSSTEDVGSLVESLQDRLTLSLENTPPMVRYLWDEEDKVRHPPFHQNANNQTTLHSHSNFAPTQRSPRGINMQPVYHNPVHPEQRPISPIPRAVSPIPVNRPASPNPKVGRPISPLPRAPSPNPLQRPVSPLPPGLGLEHIAFPPGLGGNTNEFQKSTAPPFYNLDSVKVPPQNQPLEEGSRSSTSSPDSDQEFPEPVNGQIPVCRYYAQGYCSRGDRCNYSHTRDPLAPLDNSPPKEKVEKGIKPPKNRPVSPPAGSSSLKSRTSNSGSRKHEIARLTSIDQVIGQVYGLCKDQHGCRFLQRKLEENNPRTTEIIFSEVYPHIVELMTDPFGNYLCQKLLEYCNDKQRLLIVEKVAGDLVSISKNMHGTRAVQKMIEYLNSGTQIQIVINALRTSVVPLIQDLNGNHVIQRFLNKLSPEDNQFVYDAVAGHCVAVATHRHGCCVLQRCIDHAAERQKIQLVKEITSNALTLVQDPYGNYVVQYVLDLPYAGVAAALIKKFSGHLSQLSMQKFSSNVIEKCLNVSDLNTRKWMIEELLESEILGTLLQDPFANYVIQTALTISEPEQHLRLVEAIKPHLPALRNTPYGKRIQNKITKETTHLQHAHSHPHQHQQHHHQQHLPGYPPQHRP